MVSYHTPHLLYLSSDIMGAVMQSEEGGVAFMMACWMFMPPGLQVASNAFLPFK